MNDFENRPSPASAMRRATAALGDAAGFTERDVTAELYDAVLRAQVRTLGHSKIEPATVIHFRAMDHIVQNLNDRAAREDATANAAQQAVQDELRNAVDSARTGAAA